MKLNTITRIFALTAIAALSLVGTRSASARGLQVYLSAPSTVTSPFSDTTVNTFNSLSTGVYSSSLTTNIGTYQAGTSNKLAIVADDAYGSGTGNYMAIGAQSGTAAPVTLNLNSNVSYFGFQWNAGDANNGVTLWKGDTQIGRLSTATILSMLSSQTVTAVDGSVYQSSKYFGKPGSSNTNKGEPYAFINIIDTDGVFDKVVFDNSNAGTGFETDNHTIRTTAPTPLGSFVSVGSIPTSVPEASTVALLAIGCGMTTLALVNRRKAVVATARI